MYIYWAKGEILNFLKKKIFWCLEGSKTVFSKKRENGWFWDFEVFLHIIRYINGIVELMLGFFSAKSLKCVLSKSKSIWSENTSKSVFWAQKFDFLISSNHCICHGNAIKSIFTRIKKLDFSEKSQKSWKSAKIAKNAEKSNFLIFVKID